MLRSKIHQEIEKVLSGVSGPQKTMWEQADAPHRLLIEQALFYLKHHIAGEDLTKGPSAMATARWILGTHPTELGKGLTHREASFWLRQSEHSTPQKWLWAEIVKTHPELKGVGSPRPMGVIRWVQEFMSFSERKAAALRPRTGILGEAYVGGRMVDRLDEIRECDLHKSPIRTLEAAQQRLIDQEWAGDAQLIPVAKWHEQLPTGIAVLTNYRDLRREGIEMRHCASSYAQDIADGRCLLFAFRDREGARSTAEFRDGEFRQHVGFGNSVPPTSCKALLESLVKEQPWRHAEH